MTLTASELQYVKSHPFYEYIENIESGKYNVGRYIKLTIKDVKASINGEEYIIDVKAMKKITQLTKIINFADGAMRGKSIYSGLAGFQWFLLISVLCIKKKEDINIRRYRNAIMLIARKNGKTFLVALIFILSLLLEDPFSELYSVAPDKELSGQVKKEANKLISVSPSISKHFHITNKSVECKVTKSVFEPLAYSENRLDGRLSKIFLADEVGALPSSYPIESMRSSQVTLPNGLGFVISTAYPSLNNPMIDEVKTAKDILDGFMPEDEGRTFSLIYEPDNQEEWNTEEAILQANPLCYNSEVLLDELKVNMARAERIESSKANYLTKHLNIFVDGQLAGEYINIEDLKLCRTGSYDWNNKEVYVGVDLSLTTDNTAVTMVHFDPINKEFVAKSWAFLPNHDVDIKSKNEGLNYYKLEEEGLCFIQGDRVIDYNFVEEFVMNIQDKYGVQVKGIGYDVYNAASSVSKWINAGYRCIEVPQRSGVLHGATKLLKEEVLKQQFLYESNILYEKNFSNARETKDSNLNTYINKKKSTGKIDMVASTINAMHLWSEDILSGNHIYEERGLIIL